MKRILTLIVLGVICLTCNRTETPVPKAKKVIISLSHLINNQILTSNKYYNLINKDSIRLVKLKYYIGNFVFHSPNAHLRPATSNYYLIDGFINKEINIGELPADNYHSVSYTIGIDSVTNAASNNTGDLDVTTNGDMYWAWTKEYKFLVNEGYSKNDTSQKENAFVIHVAGNSNIVRDTLRNIVFQNADNYHLICKVDIGKLFLSPNKVNLNAPIDIQTEAKAKPISQNIKKMISLY
ncbi:MAG: MbnP family protein [Bacteroidota bacterium]|nr:MbnP family protein [Bacteroidota bacterium]